MPRLQNERNSHINRLLFVYRSESLGQVFLFLMAWLYIIVKDKPSESWKGIWLAYDNMCQLVRLKAGKKELPLPHPFNKMWMEINKIIDGLHIKNHSDPDCQNNLHPNKVEEMYPELKGSKNTQAAEQTFIWLGRYKKILTSMPKTHHLFFIHRAVKRRNSYSAKCYKQGKKPLLPSVRNRHSS